MIYIVIVTIVAILILEIILHIFFTIYGIHFLG